MFPNSEQLLQIKNEQMDKLMDILILQENTERSVKLLEFTELLMLIIMHQHRVMVDYGNRS